MSTLKCSDLLNAAIDKQAAILVYQFRLGQINNQDVINAVNNCEHPKELLNHIHHHAGSIVCIPILHNDLSLSELT